MSWLYKYWVTTLILGSYHYGYETSIKRDKSKDKILFMKFIIAAPVYVPYYNLFCKSSDNKIISILKKRRSV